jgi:hypothetical protein
MIHFFIFIFCRFGEDEFSDLTKEEFADIFLSTGMENFEKIDMPYKTDFSEPRHPMLDVDPDPNNFDWYERKEGESQRRGEGGREGKGGEGRGKEGEERERGRGGELIYCRNDAGVITPVYQQGRCGDCW